MTGDFVALVLAVIVGYAILDLWRHGDRWAAIAVSVAAWVILLIVIAGRLLDR